MLFAEWLAVGVFRQMAILVELKEDLAVDQAATRELRRKLGRAA